MSGYDAAKRQARADTAAALAAGASPAFYRDLAARLDRRGDIAQADGIREALRGAA